MDVRETPDPVLMRRDGPVLVLNLNRPEKANAFEPPLVDALRKGLREAAADRAVTVVVITGAGRTFCAGLDLKYLATLPAPEKRAYLQSVLDLFLEIWRLPQPVIAAINGPAMAGGFDLASFCDLRFATTESVFAQTEILLGLNAISTPLFHSIGLGAARELALLGDKVSAQEAHRIGFVNRLYAQDELLPRTLEVAARIASRSRDAVLANKRVTREMVDQTVEEGLRASAQSILDGMGRDAHAQLLSGYLQNLGAAKRPKT